jgi:hypothetical protein
MRRFIVQSAACLTVAAGFVLGGGGVATAATALALGGAGIVRAVAPTGTDFACEVPADCSGR